MPLFGGLLGNGGCRVLRLDPSTFAVTQQIPTGESPEEIAFVTHADGSLRLGFVSNSSSSTVTVFDDADLVVANIPIPIASGGPWPTAFPFGMVVSPDQSRVYVSTLDGQGWVHAIDTSTLTLDPARSIQLGANHSGARMIFAGNLLVVAVTEGHAGWTGSTAKVVVVNLANPQSPRELVLATANNGINFPSPQDCAVDCDGIVWLAGFDMGAFVFGIEPRSLTLRWVIPTHTSQPDGKFQALGLSPNGLLVVGDFWTSELAVIDARRRIWRETLDTTALPQFQRAPQDIEFSPDSRTMVVPWAASDGLGVYDL